MLEWAPVSSSRGSSRPGDRTRVSYVSCTGKRVFFYHSAIWEAWKEEHPVIQSLTVFISGEKDQRRKEEGQSIPLNLHTSVLVGMLITSSYFTPSSFAIYMSSLSRYQTQAPCITSTES